MVLSQLDIALLGHGIIEVMEEERSSRDEQGHWLPGHSGNPIGRAKMPVSLVQILKDRLRDNPQDAERLVDSLVKLGIGKDRKAIKDIMERTDGKVAETHRIEGELPVRLVFLPAETTQAKDEND